MATFNITSKKISVHRLHTAQPVIVVIVVRKASNHNDDTIDSVISRDRNSGEPRLDWPIDNVNDLHTSLVSRINPIMQSDTNHVTSSPP